jgi:hypothetical protein
MRMMAMTAAVGMLMVDPLVGPRPAGAAPELVTEAERSGWKRTGRYAETVALCDAFARAFPGKARCLRFGKTPEGRELVALVASADGVLTPEAARSRGRPVLLAQGGIHAGEIDGKDAGFHLLRDLLQGKRLPGVLGKVTFVFVPVFNVDGHERFGRYNRPNQVGPEEMGWRTTAQNYNLNRDYCKADSPEMAAMLRLLGAWDPIAYADLHVTDGAEFQTEVAVVTDPYLKGPEALLAATRKLTDEALLKVQAKGIKTLNFYPSFRKEDVPGSGFEPDVAPPRFSNAYWSQRNRVGVLVETHSWKDYATRVRATEAVLEALLELLARDGAALRRAAAQADAAGGALAGTEVALSFESTGKSREISFPGYAYRTEKSDVSGAPWIQYDPAKPEEWKVPLFDELKPKLSVTAPLGGYVVPPAHAGWMAEKLKLHGISFRKLARALPAGEVETFRATSQEFGKKSYEGHLTLKVQGAWAKENREVPAGSLFVPIRQPLARLAMQLLEPQAPDSYLSWGFFNTAFEPKEYMEAYVAEKFARELMARDPAVKAEFEKRLKEDAELAKSPEKRLEFFYRKHPSFDERLGLYPVFRLSSAP